MSGALVWAPYNLSYLIPSVWIGWLSWIRCKSRYMDFWSKYNFVLSAALGTGISIAAIVIFFVVVWNGISVDWWGNSVGSLGYEDDPCVLLHVGPGEHFGPGPGQFH